MTEIGPRGGIQIKETYEQFLKSLSGIQFGVWNNRPTPTDSSTQTGCFAAGAVDESGGLAQRTPMRED